jgi:hypothetical protein
MNGSLEVFLCYAREDQELALELGRILLGKGLRPVVLPEPPEGPPDWRARLRQILSTADFFVLLLSQNSVNDRIRLEPNLRERLDLLWEEARYPAYLIPILCDSVETPEDLRAFRAVDLRADSGFQQLLELIEEETSSREACSEFASQVQAAADHSGASHGGSIDPRSYGTPETIGTISEEPEHLTSASQWEYEIRMLLGGRRERALLERGVYEYVEGILANAADYDAAIIAFRTALLNVLQTWPFPDWTTRYSHWVMLRLVQSYRPAAAYVQVFRLLQHLQRFPSAYSGYSADQDQGEDPHYLALTALESYFPFPVLADDQTPAYKTYLDLLKDESLNSMYVDHAIARLVALKEIDLERQEVQGRTNKISRLIAANKRTVTALVRLLLERYQRFEERQELSRVYAYCLLDADVALQNFDAERTFEEAVASCGGDFERSPSVPVIQVAGRTIKLAIPNGLDPTYFEVRMSQEKLNSGMQKYYGMTV